MHDQANAAPGGVDTAIDPVCGMTVDPETASDRGLRVHHEDVDYFFCGRGCKLDFLENPATFLAPDHHPRM